MDRETPMDRAAADRITTAAQRAPDSDTAQSGFADRAQAAADRNEPCGPDDEDGG